MKLIEQQLNVKQLEEKIHEILNPKKKEDKKVESLEEKQLVKMFELHLIRLDNR